MLNNLAGGGYAARMCMKEVEKFLNNAREKR
jgi:hypothetical protein